MCSRSEKCLGLLGESLHDRFLFGIERENTRGLVRLLPKLESDFKVERGEACSQTVREEMVDKDYRSRPP